MQWCDRGVSVADQLSTTCSKFETRGFSDDEVIYHPPPLHPIRFKLQSLWFRHNSVKHTTQHSTQTNILIGNRRLARTCYKHLPIRYFSSLGRNNSIGTSWDRNTRSTADAGLILRCIQQGIFLPKSTFRADSTVFVQRPCAIACIICAHVNPSAPNQYPPPPPPPYHCLGI